MENEDVPVPVKYFARFSESSDYDNIVKFYQDYKHHNVRARDQDLMKELAENGSVVLLEDAQGKIVGTIVSYPLVSTDAAGTEHQKWSEIGSTRIVLNGFSGILDVLTGMSVLRTFLVEPPEDRFIAKIGHPAVQKMAEKLGWREFTPEQEAVELAAKTKRMEDDIVAPPDSGTNPKWYQAGMEALPIMAKFMIEAMDHPVLTNKKTGAQIEIDLSKTRFLKMFEPEIRALAGRDLGSIEQPAQDRSVAQARAKWMQKTFK